MPRWSGREILDLLIEFSYLAAIFLVPLYFAVWFPTYNIFELNKLVLLQIFVWPLLFFTLVKVIFYWPFAPFKGLDKRELLKALQRYWLLPAVFIVGLALGLIFSINPQQSFFGSYERQEGLLSYLFYFGWFILISFNILSVDNRFRGASDGGLEAKLARLIKVAIWSGFFVSLYGLCQLLGFDFLSWPEAPLLTKRALSSLGQPNFFASFLLLVIPLSFYQIFKNRRFGTKFVYFLILVFNLGALFASASRGALLVLVVILVVYLVYLNWSALISRAKKIGLSLLLLLIISGGLFGLEKISPGRLSSLADYRSGSVAAHLNFYGAALDAWLSRPVFGYGLENGGEVFIRYYRPDWGIYGNVGASTDRAHNLVLDILVATGLWGLLLFTWLFYLVFRLAGENLKKRVLAPLTLALTFGAAAYFLSLFFSFSFVAGQVYFWSFFALLAVINFSAAFGTKTAVSNKPLTSPEEGAGQKVKKFFPRELKVAAALLFGALSLWQISLAFKNLIADHYFNAVNHNLALGDYFSAFKQGDYLAAEKTNPVNEDFYNRFWADKLTAAYASLDPNLEKPLAEQKLQVVFKALPNSGYRNLLAKAEVADVFGAYEESEAYFSQVRAITPFWPSLYLQEAKMFTNADLWPQALDAYASLEGTLPDVNSPYINAEHLSVAKYYQYLLNRGRGDLYFQTQAYNEAEEYYQLAYGYNLEDFTLFKKIADTYYARGNLDEAIDYNERGLSRDPKDYNWFLALALLYQQKDEKATALNYFNQAVNLEASLKERSDLETVFKP